MKVKKCFGKGFGWIRALNRWSVQEHAHISFCPITLQVLIYLARELCRQIAAYILSRLTPVLLAWEVRKGGWGEGSNFFPEAQNLHVNVRKRFLAASWLFSSFFWEQGFVKVRKSARSLKLLEQFNVQFQKRRNLLVSGVILVQTVLSLS